MRIMIKEKLTAVLCMFCCFLLQSSVFPQFLSTRNIPNLILAAVCVYAWLRGEYSGMFCGFFGGLFIDIFFMDTIGLHALIYVYVGFLCGQFHRFFDEHEHRMPLLMIVVSDLCVLLLEFLLFDVLYGDFHFGKYFFTQGLPEMVMTLVASIALYPLLLLLETRFVQVSHNKNDTDDWGMGDSNESGSEGVGG